MRTTHDDTRDDAPARQFEARLAALEQDYARKLGALEREVTALRAQQSSNMAVPDAPLAGAAPAEQRTSRRGMLRTALGAAAGAGAVTLLKSGGVASANTGDPTVLGTTNVANAGTQVKWNGASGFTGVILLGNDTSFSDSGAFFPAAAGGWAGGGAAGVPNGVYGYTQASNGNGVVGVADASASNAIGVLGKNNSASITALGVSGVSDHGTGVSGSSANNVGVSGSGGLTGVVGTGTGSSGTGVSGSGQTGVSGSGISPTGAPTGFGVSGTGNIGVTGSSSTSSGIGTQGLAFGQGGTGVAGNSKAGTGVLGITSGNADGVLGQSVNPALLGNGVHAVTGGIGPTPGPFGAVFAEAGPAGNLSGVYGTSAGNNGVEGHGKVGVYGNGGTGVKGISASGYGGDLQGGKAPLRLRPAAVPGPPSAGSHLQGELYVDVAGLLFLCVASGSPGTWKMVQLV